MNIKISSFNCEKIRGYMLNSSIMQKGIEYAKSTSPGISDEVAKETAIRLAQQYCQQKWQNDSTGYISNEYVAFTEFEKDVKAGRYFSTSVVESDFGCLWKALLYYIIGFAVLGAVVAIIYVIIYFIVNK